MPLSGSYNKLNFTNSNQLYKKFFDFNSLSANFVDSALTSLRERAELSIDYSNFSKHIYFNSAEQKVKTAIEKILSEYPIGLSGSSTSSLSSVNVAEVDNYINKLNGFEKYVLNYIGGVTGNPKINNIPTLTASVTTNNNVIVPLIYIDRDSTNKLRNSQTALTANLYSLATAFDSGLNRIFLSSGTADHEVLFVDDNILYKSKVVPDSINETINRDSNLRYLLPETLFSNDINNVFLNFISVISQIFDDIKIYIDQLSNINHISYDDDDRVPNGLYQQLLAKHFGFEIIDTLMYTDISSYLRRDTSKESLHKVTEKIWNRILNNLIYILKRKGNKESVYALIRTYGLPEYYLNINDYNYYSEPTLQHKIEYKNVKALKFNQGGWIEFNSSLSGSFSAASDFSVEARISTSALSNSHYILHFQNSPSNSGYSLYFNQQTRSLTFNVLGELGNSYVSISSENLNAALSSNNLQDLSYINVLGTRRGNSLLLYAGWIDETSGSAIYKVVSGTTSNVSSASISSNAKFTIGSSANGVSSWNGIIHEVKFYNFSLNEKDFEEHVRNYESISFVNTISGTLSGIVGQWKLKEGVTLTGIYNVIVNSLNSTITGAASGTLTSNNFYTTLESVRKETSFTNFGDFIDDNVDVYINTNTKFKKSNNINISFNPVSVINSDIINVFGNINIANLISDPSNFYDYSSINQAYNGYPNLSISARTVFSRYKSKINFNNYINALQNLQPIVNGILNDINQLIPVRSKIKNRGIVIEPHLLERSRYVKEKDSIGEITQYKPNIFYFDDYLKFNNVSYTINSGKIESTTVLSGSKSYSNDIYSLSSRQLSYVSKYYSVNAPEIISNSVVLLPFEQKVYNPQNTNLLIISNRNFIKNLSTVTNWETSITGNIKLIRESSGKIIKSQEKTIKIILPFDKSTNENYINFYINNSYVDITKNEYEFTINSKNGIDFKIERNNTYLDKDIGILYIIITNKLNGNTDSIPIILMTDENNLGGTFTIENKNFESQNFTI